MIAVDANLLVYSHRQEAEQHAGALACIARLRSGHDLWAIPWPCVHEFFSVVTHPRIFSPASSAEEAFLSITTWRANGNLVFLAEGAGYLDTLRQLVDAARVRGGRIHEARIAAICQYHGVRELWTADRDFSSFPRLKTRNPLVG